MNISISICIFLKKKKGKVNFFQLKYKVKSQCLIISSYDFKDLMFMLEMIFSNLIKFTSEQSQPISMTDNFSKTNLSCTDTL